MDFLLFFLHFSLVHWLFLTEERGQLVYGLLPPASQLIDMDAVRGGRLVQCLVLRSNSRTTVTLKVGE